MFTLALRTRLPHLRVRGQRGLHLLTREGGQLQDAVPEAPPGYNISM